MKRRSFRMVFIAGLMVQGTAWADWILSAGGNAVGECGNPVQKNFVLLQGLSGNMTSVTVGGSSDGSCLIGPALSLTSSATFQAHAGFGDVSGSAQGEGLGGTGSSAASYIDDVTLHPPPSFTATSVTFGMVANYDVQVNASNGPSSFASASLSLLVPAFSESKQFVVFTNISGNGEFTGVLQTGDMTFVHGPFETQFQLAGGAGVVFTGGSASANFKDPVSFILPAGWTYSLASQTASTVPEPCSLTLTVSALGLIAIRQIRRRRSA